MSNGLHGKDEGLFLRTMNSGVSYAIGCLVFVVFWVLCILLLGAVAQCFGTSD